MPYHAYIGHIGFESLLKWNLYVHQGFKQLETFVIIYSYLQQWHPGGAEAHHNQREQIKQAHQHMQLSQQQNTDPKMWDISFPDSDECNKILNN